MHRIDGAGHVDHLFVAEDPATLRPPTEITPEIMNAFQEELATFIEWAGIVLAKGDNTQLKQALLAKFAGLDVAATKAGVQGQTYTAFTTTGASGAFILTPNPAISDYAAGQRFRVKFHAVGNGADSINVSGKGLKNIKQYDSTGAKVAAVIVSGLLSDMEYDGVDMVLLDPLPTTNLNIGQLKNSVINGACGIAQRAVMAAINLSTSAAYGYVDQFACWGTGTAVSAGTITQDTASLIGRTGNALKLAGVTITGAGVVFARHRIQSKRAKKLKNQAASFSVQVYHDVGTPINYVVTLRKANAADNFSSTTLIAASAGQAVANATGTLVTFQNVNMGDCSNGVEIEVQAQCGAVVTKSFSFTEWQLEEGASVTAFERRDDSIDMSICREHLRVLSASDWVLGVGGAYSPTAYMTSLCYDKPMRASPSLSGAASGTINTFDGAGTTVTFSSVSINSSSPSAITFLLSGSGYTVNRGGIGNITAGAIALSAEL